MLVQYMGAVAAECEVQLILVINSRRLCWPPVRNFADAASLGRRTTLPVALKSWDLVGSRLRICT